MALIWITQISSGSVASKSRTGGFCENSPSQYTPPASCTDRNSVGMAAEASTASAVISPAAAVERLEFAGHHVDGAEQQPRRLRVVGDGRRTSRSRRTCVSRPRRWSSAISRRGYVVRADRRGQHEVGDRLAHSAQVFIICSAAVDAELSAQNCRAAAPALVGSSPISADQASSAQIAPPEVPLSPTTR